MEYIPFECHKQYSHTIVEDRHDRVKREVKIPHELGALADFLAGCALGNPVAVEMVSHWYWDDSRD
ncbi:MAG: hypothetical protein QXQ66_07915 [Candidatus Hadarchaeum sp.]|uniref:hypothetical protein n=1 Tax=Candidatus Hadarchaeum sp. TaxID=2883567 RepID=UPI00317AB429